jgi:hemerythrin
MRAARYGSLQWHKRRTMQHRGGWANTPSESKRETPRPGFELAEYLTSWLHDHTRLADRMMGAFLRNQQR